MDSPLVCLQHERHIKLVSYGPLYDLVAEAHEQAIVRLDFLDKTKSSAPTNDVESPLLVNLREELERYFDGEAVSYETPLEPEGTPFQHAVWNALREIPYGETCSYAQIARAIGRPTACRAVAQANSRNPISILIPCHRVIGADGNLTGYASGLDRKRWLLDLERGQKSLAP